MARADSVSSFESDSKKPAVIKQRSGKSTLKGLVYGFGAATCYGLLICAVKLLYKISTVTVFEILYLRSFVAMIIVSCILYYHKVSPFEIKRHVALCLSIRCITGFLGFATEFFAVKFTELSKIVIILYNPFLTSLMSFLIIGERVNR
jgi:drug/metabolite transporter (DMT)-like permease